MVLVGVYKYMCNCILFNYETYYMISTLYYECFLMKLCHITVISVIIIITYPLSSYSFV